PTNFVEKIWKSFHDELYGLESFDKYLDNSIYRFQNIVDQEAKKHTIRFLTEKQAELWQQPNRYIHFVINNRTKRRFQFAPLCPVVSVQEIDIKYFQSSVLIQINNAPYEGTNSLCFYKKENGKYVKFWNGTDLIERIAINDGFKSVDGFLSYFNKEAVAKQISLGK